MGWVLYFRLDNKRYAAVDLHINRAGKKKEAQTLPAALPLSKPPPLPPPKKKQTSQRKLLPRPMTRIHARSPSACAARALPGDRRQLPFKGLLGVEKLRQGEGCPESTGGDENTGGRADQRSTRRPCEGRRAIHL